MVVFQTTDLGMTPTLGALLGTQGQSGAVLDEMNRQYTNDGVMFGQNGDPNTTRYDVLKRLVQDQLLAAGAKVEEIRSQIVQPYQYKAITDEEGLRSVPLVMELPILMYKPVRQLFEDGRIDGYGYEADFLPVEDYYGRLIDNGKVVFDTDAYEDHQIPDEFVEEYRSTDPDISDEDLDKIRITREFIGRWIDKEMSEGGQWRDPTDLSNKISKIKKRHKDE